MGIANILKSNFFSHRYKLPVHIVQLILIVIAMGCSAPRLFMKNQPRTRANTIALGMGAKSLIIISYQLCSEHIRSCQRWRSYKAYAILNGLETVFWGAVSFMIMRANMKQCSGVGCYLSWVVVGVSVVMNQLCVYMFIVTFREFREHKQGTCGDFKKTRSTDSQEIHLTSYAQESTPVAKPMRTQQQPTYPKQQPNYPQQQPNYPQQQPNYPQQQPNYPQQQPTYPQQQPTYPQQQPNYPQQQPTYPQRQHGRIETAYNGRRESLRQYHSRGRY